MAEGTVIKIFQHQTIAAEESHIESHIKSLRDKKRTGEDDKQDPYMGLNLGILRARMLLWKDHLPELEPAVDCTMVTGLDPVMKVMSGAGSYFYAVSINELKCLIDLGVDPEKIIFGQTVKQSSHLQYSKDNNIGHIAFDSAFELHKIRGTYKEARLLIRISTVTTDKTTDGAVAKYGRNQQSCQDVLNTARMLGLKVEGVIAVIKDPSVRNDIKDTCNVIRVLFEYANKALGYKMATVFVKFNIDRDLSTDEGFIELADSMNRFFLTSFRKMPGQNPKSAGIKIIVDAGEYFIKDSVSLAATVIGVRRLGSKENKKVSYYVNESIYQSFSHVRIKPYQQFTPSVLFYTSKIKSTKGGVTATVYGYSDCEEDVIAKECILPGDMSNGDMLCFYGLGPYVKTFASSWVLNSAVVYYFCTTEDVPKIQEWVPSAVVCENEMTI